MWGSSFVEMAPSFVRGVGGVAAARVFFFIRPELKDLVAASPDFSSVPGMQVRRHGYLRLARSSG